MTTITLLSLLSGLALAQEPAVEPEATVEPAVEVPEAVIEPAVEEPVTVAEAWAPLLDQPQLAAFFSGMFTTIGVRVTETGEELTFHHQGDHFTMDQGLDKAEFVVEIGLHNVENMVGHGADAQFDTDEAYAILAVMFTPLTRETLKNPVLSNDRLRRWTGVEDLVHVSLMAPDGAAATQHTLIYANDQWLVMEGLHGEPARVFEISVEQAIDYQRHAYAAMQADSKKEWRQFARWYKTWRQDVSVD